MVMGSDWVVGMGNYLGSGGVSYVVMFIDGDIWEVAVLDFYLSDIVYGNGVFVVVGNN